MFEKIDVSKLRRNYRLEPLCEGEYITKEEFGYLYIELNMSFDEIDEFLQSPKGTALKMNRRKQNAKKSNKFGFKKSPEQIAAHMRKSFTEKTGLTSVMQREDVREKVKQSNECVWKEKKDEILSKMQATMVERYGVVNPTQNEDLRKKAIKTKREKYGNGNNNEKIKQTKIERYDDPTFLNKEKRIETNLKKFGSSSPFGSMVVKEKAKQTIKEKYGVDNVFLLKEVQQKIRKCCIDKHSVPYPGERYIDHFSEYNKDCVISKFVKDNYFLFDEALEYFKINQSSLDAFKRRNEINYPNKHKKHLMQNEIYEYIKEIYKGDVICDTRGVISPLELDIYIPEKKIAIEFDGLMYHSASCKEEDTIELKKYHLNKTLRCRELGIKLFHIFENEWCDPIKRNVWKSVVANSLGVYDKVIYARQCTIVDVDSLDKSNFLTDNHLQGDCVSSINIGLLYEGELVSLMTFGNPRFSKSFDYELIRFCSKCNYSVRYAASKLLHYFREIHKGSIISYANQRWSDGSLYEKIGFEKLLNKVEPSYFYFNMRDKVLYSRTSCQKHLLKKCFSNFDDSLTESEIMFNNGFYKIYDCGSLTYFIKHKQ